jgi:hypothetical protein
MASSQVSATHNPAYLLAQGELRKISSGQDGEILFYEELVNDEMPTARVLFRKTELTNSDYT